MKMWRSKALKSRSNFVVGFVIGAVLFSGSAYAVSNYVSDNTPENGYLLCANKSTKAVTFPNKLRCPSGTIALDLGAATGIDGVDGNDGTDGYNGVNGLNGLNGLTGPAGPAGSSTGSKSYYKKLDDRDIVVDGVITDSAKAKVFIMGIVQPSDMPLGYYRLDAHLSGLWSETVFNLSSKPYVKCYFQDKKDYDSGSGLSQHGAGKADYVSWTGIALNVQGYAWFITSTDTAVYLVCETTAIMKEFGGVIEALSADSSTKMKG